MSEEEDLARRRTPEDAVDSRTAGAAPGAVAECRCVSCAACHGRGHLYVDLRGRVVEGGFDDLCDLETCDDCGGSGITEECDACREAWGQDEEEWR